MRQLKPQTKVHVIYPDSSDRWTTVAELMAFFSDETKKWQNNFFATLERDGVAFTAFAEYSLVTTVRELTDEEEVRFQAEQDNLDIN